MSDRMEISEDVTEIVEISDPGAPEIIQIVDGDVIENISLEVAQETVEITNEIVESIETIERGVPGPQGPPGNIAPAIHFDYGDATPATLYTPETEQVIVSVSLNVLTPFNGVGAKVSIGTQEHPELLMAQDENDLSTASSWEASPAEQIAPGTPIKAFITPGGGATQGRCRVLIEYAEA